jgi:ABC-2 type transport system ATP-binding protein
VLEVTGLAKRYHNVVAIRDVSFTVRPGELVGLIGPNGAGKSTTLRILTGLQRPDKGDARACGHSILTEPFLAKRHVGFVPQEIALYPFLTGEEFLRFTGRVRGLDERTTTDRIEELLDLFQLTAARERLLREYSEGMARKLAIAAAVLGRPDVLILDESLNGLDPQSSARAKRLLRRLVDEGAAVLLTSHILEVVEQVSTRVLLLHDGTIVEELAHDRLVALRHEGKSLEQIYLEIVGA